MVLDDLSDGYITRTAAEAEYGLRFAQNGLTLIEAATQQARMELEQAA